MGSAGIAAARMRRNQKEGGELMHRSVTCVAILAISACRGDAPRGGTGTASGNGSGSVSVGAAVSASASGSSDTPGACTETPLFPARATGDSGNDLYRKIIVDPATHDVYFSDLHTIYRAPNAGGEPVVVLPRAKGGGHQFWLTPDLLVLAGNDVWLDKVRAVVFTTPRHGEGGLQPVIDVPADDVRTWHGVNDVTIVGDDVYWQLDEGTRGTREKTHTFLTTSWTHPAPPKVLYTTKFDVSGDLVTPAFVVAAGRVYVHEDRGKSGAEHTVTIDLATGTVSQDDGSAGGFVMGGDARWILVRRQRSTDGNAALVRMRPDGSEAVQIGAGLLPRVATRGDTWAIADRNLRAKMTEVSVVATNGEKKRLGCVNGDATLHAIGIGDDAVYVSVFRNGKATILRFAR